MEQGPVTISFSERWKEIVIDPDAINGLTSLGRLNGNGLIATAEFVPMVGELPDWLAKAAKLVGLVDLTPDVSKASFVVYG